MRNILKNIEEKHMGFVLEDVSDEDRRSHGFAVTYEEYKQYQSDGLDFAELWAIDKELDAVLMCTGMKKTYCSFELNLKDDVISFRANMKRETKSVTNNKLTDHIINIYFEIYELCIERHLKDRLEEVKKIISDALEIYCWGSHKYNGKGYTKFSPNIEIYYQKNVRSVYKLDNFKKWTAKRKK